MKLITEIKDDVQFLRGMYIALDSVDKFLQDTDFAKTMARKADGLLYVTDEDTEEEKKDKRKHNYPLILEQNKKNLLDALRKVMLEHPEDTIQMVHNFIVLDEGEDYPHGIELLNIFFVIMANPYIKDFFTSYLQSEMKKYANM